MSCERCEIHDAIIRTQELHIRALLLALDQTEKAPTKQLKMLPEVIAEAKKRFRQEKRGELQ